MQNSIVISEVEKMLSDKTGESVEVFSANNIGGGCINHASKIVTNIGEFFLKWHASCEPDIFIREAESLSELKKAASGILLIPEVYAAKRVDHSPGFLILEFLSSGYSGNDDEKLGRGLATIHKYQSDNFGFYNDNYCGATLQNNTWTKNWIEFFRDKRLGFLLSLIQNERPLPGSELKIYEKLLYKIPQLIPEDSKPVIIHGDLWSGNYMNTNDGPALIDPASYYADREMEFAIMTMFGGFSSRFYSAYNEVNPLPSDWRERNKLYQLYHILNHYYLFGGSYQSQAVWVAKEYV